MTNPPVRRREPADAASRQRFRSNSSSRVTETASTTWRPQSWTNSRESATPKPSVFSATLDVLLVQDGGCAPGYNPVTAFLTAHMERFGRRCYAAREGFRSIVSNEDTDYRRTIYDREIYKSEEHIPGVMNVASLSDASGARFRSERYPDFAKSSMWAERPETWSPGASTQWSQSAATGHSRASER